MFIHFPIILHKGIKKGKKQALIHFVQHASDHVHFKPTIISRSFKDLNLALNNHFSIVLAPSVLVNALYYLQKIGKVCFILYMQHLYISFTKK